MRSVVIQVIIEVCLLKGPSVIYGLLKEVSLKGWPGSIDVYPNYKFYCGPISYLRPEFIIRWLPYMVASQWLPYMVAS